VNRFIYLAVMISHGNLICAIAQSLALVQATLEVYTVRCIVILENFRLLNHYPSEIAPHASHSGRSPYRSCFLAAPSQLWTTRV